MDDRERLIDFLAHHDAACPVCHYKLHNLQTDRCPECGHRLELAISGATPRLNAWLPIVVSGLVALTAGLYWVFFIALDFRDAIAYGNAPGYGVFDYLVTLALIVSGTPALIALPLRQPFLKLPRDTQWSLCRAATGLATLCVLADLLYNFATY